MAFSKENRPHTLNGILFVALFATTATYISNFSFFKQMAISPLIIGIILGIFYANSLRSHLPKEWQAGIMFSTKMLLRVGIIFYGFRLTFENIAEVGVAGIITSASVVTLTFIIGYLVGTKLLKMDRDTTILVCAGSSICGAAAVLATEPVVKADPYKSAIAVATVIIFGTLGMFLYPYLYHSGIVHLPNKEMGIYVGGTLHEVAHVVAAGHAINDQVAKYAVIVKMLRVMLLAPFLIILGIFLASKVGNSQSKISRKNITIPWFAVWFIAVAGFNSLHFVPGHIVGLINNLDTFILTMAMAALGMETSVDKFKNVGAKPIYLASILFIWLIFGGYQITLLATHLSNTFF